VREALIALESRGLVEVRIGSGIYVLGRASRPTASKPGADAAAAEVHATAGPFELMRARYTIESECAALAAKSAKKRKIVRDRRGVGRDGARL